VVLVSRDSSGFQQHCCGAGIARQQRFPLALLWRWYRPTAAVSSSTALALVSRDSSGFH